MVEPGLDLHDWETRWEDLLDQVGDEPQQVLPEMVRLVHEMLEQRGYAVDDAVASQGDDPDIIRDYLGAVELARPAETGEAEPDDVELAVENLTEIYEYLIEERP
jgi:hypothetical protein